MTRIENENVYALHFGNGIQGIPKGKSMEGFRNFFCSERLFHINVCIFHPATGSHIHVMSMKGPYKMVGELKVKDSSTKNLIGFVKKNISVTSRKLVIINENSTECYYLKASACVDKNFQIYDSKVKHGESIGFIKKEWCSVLKEMYSETEGFGIQFPTCANPKQKAFLLAAIFLIYFIYSEDNEQLQF